MKVASRQNERGIALIIVMMVILAMAVVAAGFAYSMRVEMRLARNASNEGELEWLGRSGIELARYVVAQQLTIANEPYDSLNQKWAGGPGGTNDALAEVTLDNVQLGRGTLSIKITDRERKFNINVADETVLRQALILMGVDASESSVVIDSILDWIDADDLTRVSGWESADYEVLPRPYQAKNGPIDDLSELLLVNGVTPDLYWGSLSTNHPISVPSQGLRRGFGQPEVPFYPVGLVDLFTAVADGRLNINTAPIESLQLIPGVDENIAAGIVQTRAGLDGVDGTVDDLPFRSAGELVNVPGLSRQMVGQLARYVNVRSVTFEVEVNAEIDQYRRTYRALLRRNNQRDVQVLYMYWE